MLRAGGEATVIQAEYKVKAVIDWWLSQAATLQPENPSRPRQAEYMLSKVREDKIGRDRSDLVEARFS